MAFDEADFEASFIEYVEFRFAVAYVAHSTKHPYATHHRQRYLRLKTIARWLLPLEEPLRKTA